MLIANPIYDVTLKRLLEDDVAAKYIIGSILDCEVLSLEPKPTTITETDRDGLRVYYMDFAAKILTKDQGPKSTIIEMQKSHKWADVQRFRNYLGGEYMRSEDPIVAIYFCCFGLGVNSAAFSGHPTFADLRTGQKLHVTAPLVRRLMHSSYFIQVPKIEPCLDSDLDAVLSVFAQEDFVQDSRTLRHYRAQARNKGMAAVLRTLGAIADDPVARAELENEARCVAYEERAFGDRDRKIMEQSIIIEDRDKQIEDRDRQIVENLKQIDERDKQIEESLKQIQDRDNALAEKEREFAENRKTTVRTLKAAGLPLSMISEATGLPITAIEMI